MSLLDARKKAAAKKQAQEKPAGALGALRAKRNGKEPDKPVGAFGALKKKPSGPPLAGLAARRRASSKNDFTVSGVKYHDCRILGRTKQGRPFGSVQITNGDQTWTAHNRYGSWMIGDPAGEGVMREPATLHVGSQIEVCGNLIARFDAELKSRGIKTAAQLRAEREEQEKAERKKREAAEKAAATRKAKKEAKQDD